MCALLGVGELNRKAFALLRMLTIDSVLAWRGCIVDGWWLIVSQDKQRRRLSARRQAGILDALRGPGGAPFLEAAARSVLRQAKLRQSGSAACAQQQGFCFIKSPLCRPRSLAIFLLSKPHPSVKHPRAALAFTPMGAPRPSP